MSTAPALASLTDPAVWLRNLEALYEADMRFAQELDDLPEGRPVQIEQARNGAPTAKVRLPDGKEIYLHSKFDPRAEAAKFVDGLDLKKNFVFVLSGIGLGYQVREIFDRTSSQTIVVVAEPELTVIRAALENLDFAEELKTRRLLFLPRADKGLIHTRLAAASTTMTLGTRLAELMYTKTWHADFHSEMRAFFTDFMGYNRMSFVTLLANCKLTQKNVANNLVSYVCCPPIDTLRRRFAGFPAIVVSAGPSLAKNRHLLREAKGKAVIIGVQTTLKALLGMGVEPDFVTSLDYSQVSRKFFEGLTDFGNVHLVAEPKVTWPVIDLFTGHKSLLANEFADLCLGPMAKRRDGLRAGSTVAHLSFYLAEYIGADPIIFIGQDLGFTDNVYYAPGTMVHDQWAVELNRFYTLEMKEWERIVRNRYMLRKVPDTHGRQIFTDEQMYTYLQQFERDFAASAATVIDATEGGVQKRNTTVMTFREALDKYASRQIPPETFNYRREATWFDPAPLPRLQAELENRIREVRDFQALCRQTFDLLKRLQGLVDNPPEFNKLMIPIDEIRSKVNAHQAAMHMVCYVSAVAELRRFQHDRKLEAGKTVGKERAIDQLDRDTEYMQALDKGADELIEVLDEALDRVRQVRKDKEGPDGHE